MVFQNIDQWEELLQVNPEQTEAGQLRRLVSLNIRELCLEINSRSERLGLANCLKRLKEIGQLLKKHNWMTGGNENE
ncbi:MAG: hypothetical protein NT166_07500 [Candidatus Aminicenantes bacterium]|nr:hypothetical protein [Candidatus Aminicenantes bacterium]